MPSSGAFPDPARHLPLPSFLAICWVLTHGLQAPLLRTPRAPVLPPQWAVFGAAYLLLHHPWVRVGPWLNTEAAVDKPLGGAFRSASSRDSSCSLAPLLALTAQWDVQQKPAHAQGRRPVMLGLCSPGSLTAFAYQ